MRSRPPLLLVLLLAGALLPAGAASQQLFGSAEQRLGEPPHLHPVNIIDGRDERDSLTKIGPALGLSPQEITRIRQVSGFVGCFLPSPALGSGALFLDNRHVLTASHIFFEPSGERRSRCFFKNQAEEPVLVFRGITITTGPWRDETLGALLMTSGRAASPRRSRHRRGGPGGRQEPRCRFLKVENYLSVAWIFALLVSAGVSQAASKKNPCFFS